jgi:hypothetical protein
VVAEPPPLFGLGLLLLLLLPPPLLLLLLRRRLKIVVVVERRLSRAGAALAVVGQLLEVQALVVCRLAVERAIGGDVSWRGVRARPLLGGDASEREAGLARVLI